MFRLVPEVHGVLQHCRSCQGKSQKAPTQKDVRCPSIQAGAPFQVWSMDVLGPLRTSSEGHRYLLTLKDVFSKWFEAIPLRNTANEKVLHALRTVYARFGYPLQVHTDNSTYSRSQVMQEALPMGWDLADLHPHLQSAIQLSGESSSRLEHHAAHPVSPACRRLGGGPTRRTFSPPQRRP